MKKVISSFGNAVLSREQMKNVNGGKRVKCSYTACWGADCFNMSGSCSDPDPAACTWMVSCGSCSTVSNISCS